MPNAALNESLILYVFGPVEVGFESNPNGPGKSIKQNDVREFWLKDEVAHLKAKQGCYIFAVKAAKGFKPWYVGKSGRALGKEALGDRQRGTYNDVLFKSKKGTPVLFFVVPGGNKKKVKKAIVDEVETFLIQAAYIRNRDVMNDRKTNPPPWGIQGVIRGTKGKPTPAASKLKTLMRIGN